jgi:hypothetical protein
VQFPHLHWGWLEWRIGYDCFIHHGLSENKSLRTEFENDLLNWIYEITRGYAGTYCVWDIHNHHVREGWIVDC